MKFDFLQRLLGSLGGKKKKKAKKGSKPRPKGRVGAHKPKPAAPSPEDEDSGPDEIIRLGANPSPQVLELEPEDDIFSFEREDEPEAAPPAPAAPATLAPEPAPVMTASPEGTGLLAIVQQADADELERLVAGPRGVLRALGDKQAVFGSYQDQLQRAIQARDFLTLAFVGSSLIVDSAFMRDEMVQAAQRIGAIADQLPGLAGKKAQPLQAELANLLEAFQGAAAKKAKLIETLDAKLIKAHQAKDLASLSDMASALARDALILGSMQLRSDASASSEQTGLTATSANEKAAMLNQQVAQLHQAVLDQRYQAIADVSRIVSLNAGVLADPSTFKAAQILQLGAQLQQGLRSTPEHPGNVAVCANLAKIAGVFNGPLMDKAGQLEGQVQQLSTAIQAMDHQKMFTLAVTIARSASILTDSTVMKASSLAGYVPRIDVSLKRKDFQGAAQALKSALN